MSYTNSPLVRKSKTLGVLGIHFARHVRSKHGEQDIGRQVLRCSTAPGALVAEAIDSESRADMSHKFGIALKECRELEYWISILEESGTLVQSEFTEIAGVLNEVTRMLVASRKTLTSK